MPSIQMGAERGMPGVIQASGQSTPYSFHPLTTEWLERGDGCFLLGSSVEVTYSYSL